MTFLPDANIISNNAIYAEAKCISFFFCLYIRYC